MRTNAPDAPLADLFGHLLPRHRERLLSQLAKTDEAMRGMVARMRVLTATAWATEGLTVDEYAGPPRKCCLSAYADGAGLLFAGLTLSSGWLQSAAFSRPPTPEAWLAEL